VETDDFAAPTDLPDGVDGGDVLSFSCSADGASPHNWPTKEDSIDFKCERNDTSKTWAWKIPLPTYAITCQTDIECPVDPPGAADQSVISHNHTSVNTHNFGAIISFTCADPKLNLVRATPPDNQETIEIVCDWDTEWSLKAPLQNSYDCLRK